MGEPRDDLDAWLSARVQPLPPPPGTFELIRKRARRRKTTRAVLSAAGAVAVIAVIATVPRFAIAQLRPGPPASGVAAGQTLPSSAGPARSHEPTASPTPSATPTTVLPAAPPNFQATSVTFVGMSTGWVIGQAGVPGHCATQYCTSIARTDNAGQTWYGVPAPLTGAPSGGSGVSQIRFLNESDGWAFGPELWATHDGGQTWTPISTGGLRVTALETRGNRAFAVWAHCTGTGPRFAAHCTNFAVYSALKGSDSWAPVSGAGVGFSLAGTTSSASLLLTAAGAYLFPPNGELFSGPVAGQASWQAVTGSAAPVAAPCNPGAAQRGGQPAAGMLASAGSGLVLLCAGQPAGGSQQKTIYSSQDGGKTWQQAGPAPSAGTATSLAGTPSGGIVLATSLGIQVSTDGGASWTAAQGPALPATGFSFVGMTTSEQGVAVPADPGQEAIWFTYDGGKTWQESAISK